MYARPKQTDSEKDILDMQQNFLSEKAKNSSFQPAAQAIKIEKGKKESLFSISKKAKQTEDEEEPSNPRYPLDTSYVLGDIVERKPKRPAPVEIFQADDPRNNDLGFPKCERLLTYDIPTEGKSLFAAAMERNLHEYVDEDESEEEYIEDRPPSTSKFTEPNFGIKSTIIQDKAAAKDIHRSNVEFLEQMSQVQLCEERKQLLDNLSPGIVEYLQSKRKNINGSFEPSKKLNSTNEITEMEVEESKIKVTETIASVTDEIKSVSEVLASSEAENWINFNIIEKEKLEWMKDIPTKVATLKPGESFEARFDWKGILLPYTEEDNTKDNRELYLHGEEAFRPGYTLQELFTLARSNVLQQRISAFGAIGGILNIYNQGFYDSVLELPITKIFFLLRYGLDENSLAILETVSKGLATLLYNDTDETVLDLIAETSEGYLQPIMEFHHNSNDSSCKKENIENELQNLKLTPSPFAVSVNEDENESRTSMTDFELADNDLMECLLRTNIIQRMSHVLGIIKPENTTVFSCLKILTRIARTNKEAAKKIASNSHLLQILFDNFLPGLEKIDLKGQQTIYNYPQYLVLKLFRILICQNLSACIKLISMNLLDHIKNYLHTRDDIKFEIIKVQVESLRTIRAIMLLKPDIILYKSLLPAFRYMLEWHYQNIVYEKGGPFLMKQHASALFSAISSGPVNEARSLLAESIQICCSKWFYAAKSHGIDEFSQSILLASGMNCIAWCTKIGDKSFDDFILKYLKPFIESTVFIKYLKTLNISCIILKNASDRRSIHQPLPNLGTILMESDNPQLIISQLYPVYFLSNLYKLAETLDKQNNHSLILSLMGPKIVEILCDFLKKISKFVNNNLATNYLAKYEIKFIYKLLCCPGFQEILTKSELIRIAYNLLSCMSSEHIEEIENIFETIIFNSENFNVVEQTTLSHWKQIYLETFVYPHSIIIPATEISLSMPCFPEPILPSDWPYLLLKSLLNRYLQPITDDKVSKKKSDFPESEVIKITLTFSDLLEQNGLKITSPTEKLMYLMITFMSTDSVFLEPNMKALLKVHLGNFYQQNEQVEFEFDGIFEGKSKFENLYILFLDHFQAASYGDNLFSTLVLLPLAQKYNSKWRKMVWSEHASVLRFLNCDENELLGTIESYLEPNETDVSLIKCYAGALNSDLVRKNSIPYKIAMHHLNKYKESQKITTQKMI